MKLTKKSVLSAVLALALCLVAAASLSGCLFGSNATINGVKLREFVIVYSENEPDYNKNAAEFIQKRIESVTGLTLEIVTDGSSPSAHEIIVGETSRELSAALNAETDGLEFAILADGESVALEGDYFVIAAAAYYFFDTYMTDKNFEAQIPIEVTVSEPITKAPENYIFLIGDGMGVYQTRLFEYMDTPSDATSDGESLFYGYMLPYMGQSVTNSLSEGATDSAAGGTALATGYKTYNTYIGKDKDQNDVMSLTELASSLGKATAVMSTETITGATPASFSAHAFDRDSTNDIRASQLTISDNGTVLKSATDTYINSTTEKIIKEVLDKVDDDEDGFFLMYEEAYIDKRCHNNNLEGTFKTLLRFNQAIGIFMEFTFYNPDTFLIITADHETGDLHPDEQGKLRYNLDDHSTANVLVFAYGEGAEIFDGKTIENVQIPKTIAAMWGVPDFGDTSSPYPALTK